MVLTTYLWIQDLGAEGGTLGAPPPFRVRGGACAAIATMAALEEPSITVNSSLKRLGTAVVTPSPVKVSDGLLQILHQNLDNHLQHHRTLERKALGICVASNESSGKTQPACSLVYASTAGRLP